MKTRPRIIRRRARKSILDQEVRMRPTVSTQRRDYDRISRDVNARPRTRALDETCAPPLSLETVRANGVLSHTDDDGVAAFLLGNCLDEMRNLCGMGLPVHDPHACDHARRVTHDEDGHEACVECGLVFARVCSETSWMDLVRAGTHYVSRKHVYDGKAYFRGHLRNLFAQTRARPAHPLVVAWARARAPASGRDLLYAMKGASRRVRNALGLARCYKIAHAVYLEATGAAHSSMYMDVEDKLLHMYDGCVTAFLQVRDEFGRKSFLNKHYVMRQLLWLCDAPERVQGLVPMMRMRSKIREHDRMWARMCAILKWPHRPLDTPHGA